MPAGYLSVDIGAQVVGAQAHRAPDADRCEFAAVDEAAHAAGADRERGSGVLEGE
jgi:hypothetical protein